jgi:hypothetical protein
VFGVCVFVVVSIAGLEAQAGAFMMPEGQGQMIAGVGYIEATRTFTRFDKAVRTPAFREIEASAYVEYGLTDWLTLVAAPTVARMHGGEPGETYTGSDESAIGARLPLYRDDVRIVSVQALAEPALPGAGGAAAVNALGGPNAWAADFRAQYGQAFPVLGGEGFVDIEPSVRLRGGGWPTETHLDVTLGLRPKPRLMILLQDFTQSAPSGGPRAPATLFTKVALSLVYDLAPAWSVQAGGLMVPTGRNAGREIGPLAALWHRF